MLLVFLKFVLLITLVKATCVDNDLGVPDFTNSADARPSGGPLVTWTVYGGTQTVVFEVTAVTGGWIGVGLSDGGMFPADLIIGGVNNGVLYFADRFAAGYGEPPEDTEQNWFLIEGNDVGGDTILKFYREFDTGDAQADFKIEDRDINLIWARGSAHAITYHNARGIIPVNILRAPVTEPPPTTTTPAPPSGSPDFTNSLILRDGLTVDWGVYYTDEMVLFEVTSNTIGWIGFGISPTGNMNGADLVMAKFDVAGATCYFSDRFVTSPGTPIVDTSEDWFLIDCTEENGQTKLQFYRKFETGDTTQDFVIKDEGTKFIWALGPTDELGYHGFADRGNAPVNILRDASATTDTTVTPPTPAPPSGSPDFTNSLNLGPGLSVEWSVHLEEELVVFEVTSDTTGWVGFGLNPKGNMNGADLVMGGYNLDENRSYFSDRFSSAMGTPPVDESQDWFLMKATEAGGQTVVKFYRKFDTGDTTQDYPITDEDTKFIWAVGPSDSLIDYHGGTSRGSVNVNVLKDPATTGSTEMPTSPTPPSGEPDFSHSLNLRDGFTVEWSVYNELQLVSFEVTSNTAGWVGFGISKAGSMFGADLVMGGWNSAEGGEVYFDDRFASAAGMPVVDFRQNWYLMDCSEDGGQTKLKFYRAFNTGDSEDFEIKDEETNFIWATGSDDALTTGHAVVDRGHWPVNILSKEEPAGFPPPPTKRKTPLVAIWGGLV